MTAIGIAVRVRLLLCCVLVAALASMMTACGGSKPGSKAGSNGTGDTGAATTSNETATNPPTEGTGTESAGMNRNGESVSLPSLPIGGTTDGTGLRQCATVYWGASGIPAGATVTVTSVGFSEPNVFTVVGGGCDGIHSCIGSSFSSSSAPCSVLVQATGSHGKSTVLILAGSPHCDTAQKDWCANLQAGPSAIDFTQPGSPTDTTTTSTTTTPTTVTTPSTTTTATTTTTSPPSPSS